MRICHGSQRKHQYKLVLIDSIVVIIVDAFTSDLEKAV